MTTMDQSTENPANIRGVCFCCLADGSFKNMYQSFKWLDHSEVYADMMLNCYNINIGDVARDTKPLICEVCIVRLRDSLAFRKQVENSCEVMKNATSLPETNVFELPIQKWEGDEEDDAFNWDESEAREDKSDDEEELAGIKVRANWREGRSPPPVVRRTRAINRAKSKPVRKRREKGAMGRPKVVKDDVLILEATDVYPFNWIKGSFSCAICGADYVDLEALKVHVGSHADEAIKDIIKRSKSFRRIKMDISSLKCSRCGVPFSDMTEFKKHLTEVHQLDTESKDMWGHILPFRLDNSSFQCQLCSEKFLHFFTLNKHMNTHYPNFVCEACGNAYATRHRVRSHYRRMHEVGQYACKLCGLVFSIAGKLEYHVAKVHKACGLKCPHCPLRLASFHAKRKHLVEAHEQVLQKYECHICEQSFVSAGSRSSHIRRVHLKERKHVCEACGLGFITASILKIHMVRHTGERNFVCEVCKKAYPRIKTLREHMKIHNNVRKHVCPVCNRAFIQKATLRCHMNVHKKKNSD